MDLVCLDMEGVLTPEIWIEFSRVSGIPELKRTTRDEPDYCKLMHWRMEILKEHGLGLKEIQAVIAKIDPLPGARQFLDALRDRAQVVILSDTFEECRAWALRPSPWGTATMILTCSLPAKRVSSFAPRKGSKRIIPSCPRSPSTPSCSLPSRKLFPKSTDIDGLSCKRSLKGTVCRIFCCTPKWVCGIL